MNRDIEGKGGFRRRGDGIDALLLGCIVFVLFTITAQAETPRRQELQIRDFTISVEIADTPSTRQQGLMHRKYLPSDHGMIFIFPETAYHSMWMVNTYVPLSAAFLDRQGIILNIADMEPLTTDPHSPIAPAKYVLEMNRGWFAARGIKAGDRISGLSAGAVAK